MKSRKPPRCHIDENGEALCAVERKTTAAEVMVVSTEFFFTRPEKEQCKDCVNRFKRMNPPDKTPERLVTVQHPTNDGYEPKGLRRKSIVTMQIQDMPVIEDLTVDLQLYDCRMHTEGFADYDASPTTGYYLHAFSYAIDQRGQFTRIANKYRLQYVVRTLNGGHVEGNLKVA